MKNGEELVLDPFQRLIDVDLLMGYKYERFWSMDTFKEQQELTDMYNQGYAAWEVWKKPGGISSGSSARAAERGLGPVLAEGG
jgi:NDP-sugar pyrophosphorylase family protein